MKKILYLLSFVTLISFSSFAQDDQEGVARLRSKMTEYIQQKLGLSKSEAERFTPVFLDYFKDLRRTNHDFRGDRLVLQQKIVELRLRYRDQFKPILGEKRSNDVFMYEREFIKEVKELREDRMQGRQEGRANKRLGTEL
jgi:hypothetical protein